MRELMGETNWYGARTISTKFKPLKLMDMCDIDNCWLKRRLYELSEIGRIDHAVLFKVWLESTF